MASWKSLSKSAGSRAGSVSHRYWGTVPVPKCHGSGTLPKIYLTGRQTQIHRYRIFVLVGLQRRCWPYAQFFSEKQVTHLRFFLLFILDDGRIWIRTTTNNHGSGSWRPKNFWILRIRIRNTLNKLPSYCSLLVWTSFLAIIILLSLLWDMQLSLGFSIWIRAMKAGHSTACAT